jgi:hypothetical protein
MTTISTADVVAFLSTARSDDLKQILTAIPRETLDNILQDIDSGSPETFTDESSSDDPAEKVLILVEWCYREIRLVFVGTVDEVCEQAGQKSYTMYNTRSQKFVSCLKAVADGDHYAEYYNSNMDEGIFVIAKKNACDLHFPHNYHADEDIVRSYIHSKYCENVNRDRCW